MALCNKYWPLALRFTVFHVSGWMCLHRGVLSTGGNMAGGKASGEGLGGRAGFDHDIQARRNIFPIGEIVGIKRRLSGLRIMAQTSRNMSINNRRINDA